MLNRRRAARVMTVAAACLVTGVLLNIAIAWGCCLWLAGRIAESPASGAVLADEAALVAWLPRPVVRAAPGAFATAAQRINASLRTWSGPGLRVDQVLSRYGELRTVSAGWPVRSLACASRVDMAGYSASLGSWAPRTFDAGIDPPAWARPVKASHRLWPPGPLTLPYRPLWPEFAAGAGLYAALIASVVVAARLLRRRLRRRRGRCISCGYSRAGLASDAVCPECGTGMSK